MGRVSTAPAPSPLRTRHRFRGQDFTAAALMERLRVTPVPFPRYGAVGPLLVLALAALLRFLSLSHPDAVVFDETYYAKDAASMAQFGYERAWPEGADQSFVDGHPVAPLADPEYVVHPPLGKWMIVVGLKLFGTGTPLGWRFSSAVVGTLSVLVIMWVAWMLFRSVALATVAGLLMAVDGLALVQSRLALLDIFLMFWLLLAFALLVADRISTRRRLARRVAAQAQGGVPGQRWLRCGPWLGIRWYRVAAGAACGAACGVKWNALFFVAVFGLLTVLWDIGARRAVGVRNWFTAALLKDAGAAFCSVVLVGLGTYLVTWTGWFLSSSAYDRHWAEQDPGEGVGWLPPSLRSLWHYHVSAYAFHTGLDTPHTYMSPAWKWLLLARPTSYYYASEGLDCEASSCSSAVLNQGNPLIWWTAAAAMLLVLVWWLLRRDWRMGAIVLVFAVGYLPWFAYPDRTTFFFYALSFFPWLVLGLTAVLGLALGRPGDSLMRRRAGLLVVGMFLAAVLATSAFFLPVWTAQPLPYDHWRWRMWFPDWI